MVKRIICAIGLTLVFASLTLADAQWKGANYVSAPGAWEDPANWNTSPSRVPDANDLIVKAYRSDETGSNITIDTSVWGGVKLQMKYGKSKITINNGGTLTNRGVVEMFLGTTSEVVINAGGTWNACTSVSGAVFNLSTSTASKDTISVWGTLNVDGTANPSLTIGTTGNVNGYGTVNIYGGGVVYADRYTIGSRGIIKIWTGGLFKVKGDATAQTTADIGTKIVGQEGAVLSTYYNETENTTYVSTVQPPSSFVISGHIKNDCNVPTEGVLVSASDSNSAVTDANGFYEIQVASAWSGTVTASKAYYIFTPDSRSYSNVLADQIEQDYSAENIYDLDCDGLIGWGDVAVISENWLDDTVGNICDFNEDIIVNFNDFAEFANVWLTEYTE